MTAPLIEFRNVTKKFGDIVANDGVSFSVREGSIHGVVGENGAGKSTIMKIFYGLYPPDSGPDSGSILFGGRTIKSPLDAIANGVGMVHQHFMLVPTLTAWENIILGAEKGFWVTPPLGNIERLQKSFGFSIPLTNAVEELCVGLQQQLEILKLLYRNASVLILDEPTAVLSPQEIAGLFDRLRALQNSGKTIILISHKLKEILSLCDTVTIMRQGKAIETLPVSELTETNLAEKMIGRKQKPLTINKPPPYSQAVLTLKGIHLRKESKESKGLLDNLSLTVHSGEVVGIAGIEGNGQKELVELLAGLRDFTGEASLLNHSLTHNPYEIRQKGFGLIPSDRLNEAVILDFTLEENLLLSHHLEKTFLQAPHVYNALKRNQHARSLLDLYDVRPPQPALPLSFLSGGNQQKVVVARETYQNPTFLLAAHPTRGVDIGAIEFIHNRFLALRDQGTGILLVSSELDELLALSDRILVLYQGKIQGECSREQANETQIGLWMTGGSPP